MFSLIITPMSEMVMAQPTREDREHVDNSAEYHDSACNVTTTSVSAGEGPLEGVEFPDADPAALEKAINKYIANTQPNSPLKGKADIFIKYGKEYNINPMFMIAKAQMETGLATNGAYVAQKNFLSIRHQGQFDGIGENTSPFKTYASMDENVKDYAYIIDRYYIKEGYTTIRKIIYKYAPPNENDTEAYIRNVKKFMKKMAGLIEDSGGSTGDDGSITRTKNPFVSTAYAAPNDSRGPSDTLAGHKLPSTKGGSSPEDATSGFALGEPKSPEELEWFINMRWTYAKWAWSGAASSIDNAHYSFMQQEHPKMIVTNPRTNKSVIVAALDAGPAPWTGTAEGAGNAPSYWQTPQRSTPDEYKGRVSGLSPKAFQEIDAVIRTNGDKGDDLKYAWADQEAKLGPTDENIGEVANDAGSDCEGEASSEGGGGTIVEIAQREEAKNVVEYDKNVLKYTTGRREAWCADFVSWVYKEAGKPFEYSSYSFSKQKAWQIPRAWNIGLYFYDRREKENIAYGKPGTGAEPQPGFIITFKAGDGHVGIIEKVEGNTIHTIEGNASNKVLKRTYQKNDSNIKEWAGYK